MTETGQMDHEMLIDTPENSDSEAVTQAAPTVEAGDVPREVKQMMAADLLMDSLIEKFGPNAVGTPEFKKTMLDILKQKPDATHADGKDVARQIVSVLRDEMTIGDKREAALRFADVLIQHGHDHVAQDFISRINLKQ